MKVYQHLYASAVEQQRILQRTVDAVSQREKTVTATGNKSLFFIVSLLVVGCCFLLSKRELRPQPKTTQASISEEKKPLIQQQKNQDKQSGSQQKIPEVCKAKLPQKIANAKGHKVKDGKEQSCWPDGKWKSIGEWQKGRKQGRHVGWYSNGQKKFESHWLNGQRHGRSVYWYKNGQKKFDYTSVHGKTHGKRVHWYSNGKEHWEGTYNHGKMEGMFTKWYKNGRKRSAFMTAKGKRHGRWQKWWPNGRKYKRWSFFYGKGCGTYWEWRKNGKLRKKRHHPPCSRSDQPPAKVQRPQTLVLFLQGKKVRRSRLRYLLEKKRLKKKWLEGLHRDDFKKLIGALFALRGARFRSSSLRRFFRNQRWYRPVRSAGRVRLRAKARYNLHLLKKMRRTARSR